MICFLCEDCGRRISVSDDLAERSGKCPGCGSKVIVPAAEVSDVRTAIELDFKELPISQFTEDAGPHKVDREDTFNDLGLKPIGIVNHLTGKRTKPWYIDIFLYPISTSGITIFLILILLPPIFSLIAMFLFATTMFSIIGIFFGLVFLMFKLIVRAYFFWYMAECIRYSCNGETRAPSVFSTAGDDFYSVMNFYFSLFMCFLLCFAAATISLIGNFTFGLEYWTLIGAGCVVFPILLLSIVVIDSISAWNPVTLIFAMARLMPQYLILPVALFGIIWSMHSLAFWLFQLDSSYMMLLPFLKPVIISIGVYFSYIAAHLLGRFYYLNAQRLDW